LGIGGGGYRCGWPAFRSPAPKGGSVHGTNCFAWPWRAPQSTKDQCASASICGNNRAVFNVGGSKYRLVVEIQYQAGIVWVKFVGTHAQYDRIDVETVNE